MPKNEAFDRLFAALAGFPPFPWQRELFARLVEDDPPETCDLPTGLGKTSIIAIWLLALAHRARAGTAAGLVRRLIYVVNRRTVVDQATREAEQMRRALAAEPELEEVVHALRSLATQPSGVPLAISTLRGQFADNAEWRVDPSRPAVVVGTVDMIGSRLLFSGYGCGFKSRPLHAGFLGQDALLVHDEAHLEPAFQELLNAIEAEQRRCQDFGRFRVMALTATSRGDGERFGLTDADHHDPEVKKRIGAKKGLSLHPVEDVKKTAGKVAELALDPTYKDSGGAILVFLRRLDDVDDVAAQLRKAKQKVQVLTGTLRGLERDEMAEKDPIFARFLPSPKEGEKRDVAPAAGTVYLVCTSAGEVGVNISADHLICDLTSFDSMAQRFGRVNRFGRGDARIEVVHPPFDEGDPQAALSGAGTGAGAGAGDDAGAGSEGQTKTQSSLAELDRARQHTLSLLQRLPKRSDGRHDASPAALRDLPKSHQRVAFTPPPVIPPVSDILFDAWALTTIRQKLPGRPPVADWLHGLTEWEPPETHVAWREEVEVLSGELGNRYTPGDLEDLLEDYPLKPHELLRDNTDRIFKHLEKLAKQNGALPVWVVAGDGSVDVTTLRQLTEKSSKAALNGATVLLPPKAGGLRFENGRSTGLLDGSDFDDAHRELYDVSGQWKDEDGAPRRCRVWDDEDSPKGAGMRRVQVIEVPSTDDGVPKGDEEERESRRDWSWWVRPASADDDGSRVAKEPLNLDSHLRDAERLAKTLVGKLGLREPEATAVTLASGRHDLGKHRGIWQRSIGNHEYPARVLAKSGGKMRPMDLNGYRHELGSLVDVPRDPALLGLAPEVRELTLHLIAAHHGRARPHFPAEEVFDLERHEEAVVAIAREVPRRFAQLQRKYGRWGLAYLESLVRAADILASQSNSAHGADGAEMPAAAAAGGASKQGGAR